MNTIAANLENVHERIRQAAAQAGRNADEITLVAVTKTHPVETVIAAYRAGLRHFGENRAADGAEKIKEFGQWPEAESPPQWHFIGHLQSRQASTVLTGGFSLIHSVDSLKLARRINRLAEQNNLPAIDVLLQCNVSGETSKAGFTLNNWQSNAHQFDDFCRAVTQIAELKKITIKGLMTMAPLSNNSEDARPTFKALAALQKKLRAKQPQFDWRHLSMGMTDDFDVAIQEGATIIRVGRAIFGERRY